MQVTASIFKAYDIRGIVPSTLDESVAEALGRAFGSAARSEGEQTVAVGRDGRLSGPSLSAALIKGLLASGVDVIDLGMVTTPMLYYAASTVCKSGIQVTGSHNPADYNGFKMMLAGRAIYGEEIQGLRRAMEADSYASGAGKLSRLDIYESYRDRIVSDVKLSRPIKIVVDSGNGVAGASAPAILRALGCEVQELYSEVDGTFPNHHPDPSKLENLKDLMHVLGEGDAEIGLAFDGDGDRLGAVDGEGRIVWGDQLLAIYAEEVLAAAPGATVIADVKASQMLFDRVAELGGNPLMWMTGHSLIKAKMQETAAPLAGEMSGHLFFADRYFGFDDGLYAAVRLIGLLARREETLAELRDRMPRLMNTPEVRIECAEERKFAVIDEVKRRLAASPGGGEVNDIDGVRVRTADGWWLLRASNTQPVLVARAESASEEGLARLKAEISRQLEASGVASPF